MRTIHHYVSNGSVGVQDLYFDADPGIDRVVELIREAHGEINIADVFPMFSSQQIKKLFGKGEDFTALEEPISLLTRFGTEAGTLQAGMSFDIVEHSSILWSPKSIK